MPEFSERYIPGAHGYESPVLSAADADSKEILLCLHGFAGDKHSSVIAAVADAVKGDGIGAVTFDWPAHGKSRAADAALTVQNCLEDLNTVYAAVCRRGLPVSCFATSFGGYLVLKYITERDDPFRKIALRCPAVDMYGVLTNSIMKSDDADRLMKGKDVQAGFDRKITVTRAFLDELKTNDLRKRDFLEESERILIIHGTSDEVVPFEDSRAFAEDNLIEFIAVEMADHRFQNPLHMSLANKHVMEFFGFQ